MVSSLFYLEKKREREKGATVIEKLLIDSVMDSDFSERPTGKT